MDWRPVKGEKVPKRSFWGQNRPQTLKNATNQWRGRPRPMQSTVNGWPGRPRPMRLTVDGCPGRHRPMQTTVVGWQRCRRPMRLTNVGWLGRPPPMKQTVDFMHWAARCHPATVHRSLHEPIPTPSGGETACPGEETNDMAHPRALRPWLDERGRVVLPKSRKAVDDYFTAVPLDAPAHHCPATGGCVPSCSALLFLVEVSV